MALNFEKLLNLPDGGRRAGFEQLICHLAERNPPKEETLEFCHIHGDGGDGGIECYWKLANGTEIGYQAKFHCRPSKIDWSKLDKSVRSALISHPCMTKIIVSMPRDLTDVVPGRSGKSERQKWNELCQEWKAAAKTDSRVLECEFWGHATIENMLTLPEAAGLRLYWFDEVELTGAWFDDRLTKSKLALGERYSSEDHVEVSTAQAFAGLGRHASWVNSLSGILTALRSTATSPITKSAKPFEGHIQSVQRVVSEISVGEQKWPANSKHPIDRPWWLAIATTLSMESQGLEDAVYSSIKNDDDRRSLGDMIHYAQQVSYKTNDFCDYIRGIELEADAKRFSIFEGQAGTGKSHLLGSEIEAAVQGSSPSILMLGSHFHGNAGIEEQILTHLSLKCTFSNFLDSLNARAEAKGTRAILAFDAINESNAAQMWRAALPNLWHEIQKRMSLALVISCRSEYTKFYISDDIKSQAASVWVDGFSNDDERERAAEVYMDRRGILRPAMPWLSKEFSNPLFLRSVCNSLHKMGKSQFPKGLRGITSVLSLYLNASSRTLGSQYDHTDELERPVNRLVHEMAKIMADQRVDFISIFDLEEIIALCFKGKHLDGNWSELLQRGGLLRLDPDPNNDGSDLLAPPEEVVRFAYQRFQDYLVARALLNRSSLAKTDFDISGPLEFIFDEHGISYEWIGVFAAMWTIAAEKFKVELCDVLPDRISDDHFFWNFASDAYFESTNWRENDAFTDRTLELLNSIESDLKAVEVLLNFAVLDHPWNISFLHASLIRDKLAKRDAFWTISINKLCNYERSQPFRFVDWCTSRAFSVVDDDIAQLALLTLGWLFTTTNKTLRDFATKAAVEILLARHHLTAYFFREFAQVNDPYVVERVLASVAGACLRDPTKERLKHTIQAASKEFVETASIPIHILSRDYLQIIFDLTASVINDPTPSNIAPPYGASPPCLNLPAERVKRLAEAVGASSIVASCNTSSMAYGDFGRYTLKSRIREFTNIPLSASPPSKPKKYNDPDLDLPASTLSDWVILKTLSLGWHKDHFPRDSSIDNNRAYGARTERIGKKYQWIAYHELLARLADNYWISDEYRKPFAFQYTSPIDTPYVRNIEPTLPPIHFRDQFGDAFCGGFAPKIKINPIEYSKHESWVFEKDLADQRMLQSFAPNKARDEYLGIYRYVSSRIPYSHESKKNWYSTYQEEFFFVTLIGVPHKYFDTFKSQAIDTKVDFHGWLPRDNTDAGYISELGLRTTWKDTGLRTETEGYPEPLEFTFRDVGVGFAWEGHLDGSMPDSVSIHLPAPWLFTRLNIKQSKERLGDFISSDDSVVVQTSKQPGAELLQAKQVEIFQLFNAEGLLPVWVGIGERSVYPKDHMRGWCRTRWNAMLWLDGGQPKISSWSEDTKM